MSWVVVNGAGWRWVHGLVIRIILLLKINLTKFVAKYVRLK